MRGDYCGFSQRLKKPHNSRDQRTAQIRAPLQESRQYFRDQQPPRFLIIHAFNKYLLRVYYVPGDGEWQVQRPWGRESWEHWRARRKGQCGWRVVSKGVQAGQGVHGRAHGS